MTGAGPIRFWIDIANSPHATLLAPLSRELESRGHTFLVTAWDRAQTLELARAHWPDVRMVGAGNDRGILAKGLRIARRARNLVREVRPREPGVALGHGSHAQVLAARAMRVPAISMLDYEHQPASLLHYALAGAILVPEEFALVGARRRLAGRRLQRYPGTKEEIALAGFEPDAGFRDALGVPEDAVLAVCRPAPEGALYHRGENPLFDAAVRHLVDGGATVLVSPRDEGQARRYAVDPRVRVLDHAVDGPQLLYHADLVVGAGGTMTREAAVMGTPSYTVFSEALGSVDESLIRAGRLVHVSGSDQLSRIEVRARPTREWTRNPRRASEIADRLERTAAALLGRR